MATSLGSFTARRIRRNTRQHLAGITRVTRRQQIQREAQEMSSTSSADHAGFGVVTLRPGGPSAKSFHRAGVSSTHQRNTSGGIPMVEPIPLRRHQPVAPAGTVERWSERDAQDLVLAEHHEMRQLFGTQGVAS